MVNSLFILDILRAVFLKENMFYSFSVLTVWVSIFRPKENVGEIDSRKPSREVLRVSGCANKADALLNFSKYFFLSKVLLKKHFNFMWMLKVKGKKIENFTIG